MSIVCFVIAILLCSCSKDQTEPKNELIGKWEYSNYYYDQYVNGAIKTPADKTANKGKKKFYYVFKEDGFIDVINNKGKVFSNAYEYKLDDSGLTAIRDVEVPIFQTTDSIRTISNHSYIKIEGRTLTIETGLGNTGTIDKDGNTYYSISFLELTKQN